MNKPTMSDACIRLMKNAAERDGDTETAEVCDWALRGVTVARKSLADQLTKKGEQWEREMNAR